MSDKEEKKTIGTPNSDEEEQLHFEIPKEMHDALSQLVEYQNACFRECITLLAGFKATKERDIGYMDGYMDRLYDFMDQGSDVEMVCRLYSQRTRTCFNNQAIVSWCIIRYKYRYHLRY